MPPAMRRRHALAAIAGCVVAAAAISNLRSTLALPGPSSGSDAPVSMPQQDEAGAASKRPAPPPGSGGGGWWDSSKSAVIAMASGYGLDVYEQFVGTLRATGYSGMIILGISSDPPPEVSEYLQRMNVATKELGTTKNCTYAGHVREDGKPSTDQVCLEAYPDYKLTWGRFPLARDWLLECDSCTGGAMLTDVRDAYFQSDPFAYPFGEWPMEKLPGELMVFQEIGNLTTDHWLTYIPVEKCRGIQLKGHPMLCSGSTMGTRQGILDYVASMVQEFDYWKERPECRSDMVGDDQSIHNYLYYTNQLKNAASIPHRTGPIHVVGWQADKIFRAAIEAARDDGRGEDLMEAEGFINRMGFVDWVAERPVAERPVSAAWLPPEHGLIDSETGLVTNLDGRPSPQVHQFDRFGLSFGGWYATELVEQFYETKAQTAV